jgi:hypothetical protein
MGVEYRALTVHTSGRCRRRSRGPRGILECNGYLASFVLWSCGGLDCLLAWQLHDTGRGFIAGAAPDLAVQFVVARPCDRAAAGGSLPSACDTQRWSGGPPVPHRDGG